MWIKNLLAFDIPCIPHYPLFKDTRDLSTFDGNPLLVANHVISFIRYILKCNITQLHNNMQLFVFFAFLDIDWLESCEKTSILSLSMLLLFFLLHKGPSFKNMEEACKDLDIEFEEALCEN